MIESSKLLESVELALSMHLTKSNDSMLSLTKSIHIASSAASTLSIKTNTIGERFVVQKANSLEDGFSSEAISSCSDSNDDKSSKIPPRKHNDESIDEVSFDDSSESDRDSIMDNFDVTLVDDADCYAAPKNDAERMFFEVVEFLRIEQEVKRQYIALMDGEGENLNFKIPQHPLVIRHIYELMRNIAKFIFTSLLSLPFSMVIKPIKFGFEKLKTQSQN